MEWNAVSVAIINSIIPDFISTFFLIYLLSKLMPVREPKFLIGISTVIAAIYAGMDLYFDADWFLLVPVLASILYLHQQKQIKQLSILFLLMVLDFSIVFIITDLSSFISLGLAWIFKTDNMLLLVGADVVQLVGLVLTAKYVPDRLRSSLYEISDLLSNGRSILINSLSIFITVSFFIIYYTIDTLKNDDVMIILVFSFELLLFLIITFCFYILIDANKKNLEEKRLRQNRTMIHEFDHQVTAQMKDIHKFRHDFQNMMIGLDGYINADDMPGLKHYYERLSKEWKLVQPAPGFQGELKNITDVGLQNLIYQKYMVASTEGVHLLIEADDKIPTLADYGIDIIRMIGILVDNAIEYAKQGNEKKVYLALFNNHNAVQISVANPINPDDKVNVSHLMDEGFTSKGDNHGTGLNTVRNIVESNSKIDFQIESRKQLFMATLAFEL
ncbi:GHKL domain-containing protein [Pediococcus argentinicus]|uniref:sensor histidine kinase n=1 Tax=Pediococcus argentinicus TaxID=480391 RepID=UPI00338EF5F5